MKKLILTFSCMLPLLATAQLADSSKRLLPLQGALNFRDIGGYKTADGHEVKWGKVYRSAAVNRLTDGDVTLLDQKNIHTVVDFRGRAEAAAAPDRLPPGTDYTLSPAGSDSLPNSRNLAAMLKEQNFLEKMYGEGGLPYFGDRYRPLFVKLISLDDSEAIMYHCTGGRDRTGMATALLLYTLGVPQETIEADFVASNEYLKPMMTAMNASISKESGMSEAEIRKAMELRPALLRSFFSAISAKYGSIEAFLQQEMGIGVKERAILKKKFTT